MITLKSKQAKAIAEALLNTGRLEELKRFEGRIPSGEYRKRSSYLRDKIESSLDLFEEKKEEKADEKLQIRVVVNGDDLKNTEKKKSVLTRLKELSFFEEDDEEQDTVSVIKQLFSKRVVENNPIVGRIVDEL